MKIKRHLTQKLINLNVYISNKINVYNIREKSKRIFIKVRKSYLNYMELT